MRAVIGFIYQVFLKRILFLSDPEDVHDRTLRFGRVLGNYAFTRWAVKTLFSYENSKLGQKIKDIEFRNPVGLSAGFDKDGQILNILPSVGFGFAQVGTITHKPYEGNPKPRLYRLPKSQSIVVYYGLKNIGAEKILKKIQSSRTGIPISLSIGKTNSKETNTVQTGIEDYTACLDQVIENGTGDIYTLNISCPNIFGGEPFTDPESLGKLLREVCNRPVKKPVFLKMPIGLEWEDFKKLLDTAMAYNVDGVIIGNLLKDRNDPAIKDMIPENVKGALSGTPAKTRSNDLISKTYKNFGDRLVIIGVGGIFSAKDAYEKIKLGASLVQLITGMIYKGPQLVGQINHGLVRLLEKDGFKNISEAVGSYHK